MQNMYEKNYGIQILRILLSFQVVMGHNGVRCFVFIGEAVPFFMLISFYLTYNVFFNQDIVKLKRRAFRIVYPYIAWGIISFVAMFSLNAFLDGKVHVSINDLLWQLLLGTSPVLNPLLWYLFDMIVCSFIMLLICKYVRHKFYLLLFFIIFSFLLQYTGINYAMFNGFRYEIKWPLGRLAEMIPYACAGVLFAHNKIFEKKHGNTLLIFAIILFHLLCCNYYSIATLNNGFLYQGVPLFMKTIFMFAFFHLVLFEKLELKYIKIIDFLAKYSLGIFCVHYIIMNVFFTIGVDIKLLFNGSNFIKGLFIYIVSLFVVFIIGLIPYKWMQNLVK